MLPNLPSGQGMWRFLHQPRVRLPPADRLCVQRRRDRARSNRYVHDEDGSAVAGPHGIAVLTRGRLMGTL